VIGNDVEAATLKFQTVEGRRTRSAISPRRCRVMLKLAKVIKNGAFDKEFGLAKWKQRL